MGMKTANQPKWSIKNLKLFSRLIQAGGDGKTAKKGGGGKMDEKEIKAIHKKINLRKEDQQMLPPNQTILVQTKHFVSE